MLIKSVIEDTGNGIQSDIPITSADPLPILEANNVIQMTRALEQLSMVAANSHKIFASTYSAYIRHL